MQTLEEKRAYRREWYLKNRDKMAQWNKEYHLRNKDVSAKKSREWRLANKDKLRESSRKWSAENREKANTYSRKSYYKNRSKTLEKRRELYSKNEYRKEYFREWVCRNKDKTKKYARKSRIKNKLKIAEWRRGWRLKNKEKVLEYNRNRQRIYRKSSPQHVLSNRIGCAMWRSLRQKKAARRWEDLVGYTAGDLKTHLESLFAEGMTWKLLMQGKIHIDHIMPVSRFKYEYPEDPEFKICWGLSNLQPLWAADNLKKNDKILCAM